MPPRKQSQDEQLKYAVEFESVKGAKMNALRISFQLYTIPHFIEMLKCGCKPKIVDPNPYDSATAAALLQTLEENMIVFKNTKNQAIEMHHSVFHGLVVVTFSLPTAVSSIRQAMQIIKKSINKKLISRAYKLLVTQDKDHKAKKEEIMDSVAAAINSSHTVTIFSKILNSDANKDKIKKLVAKIKTMIPKKVEQGKHAVKPSTAMPHHQDIYTQMVNTEGHTRQVLAFLNASLQAAGFDFFTDITGKKIFIANQYCSAAHTAPLKLFIQTRLRFLIKQGKLSKDAISKKLDKINEFIHMQSATVGNLNESIYSLTDTSSINGINYVLDKFSTLFKQ